MRSLVLFVLFVFLPLILCFFLFSGEYTRVNEDFRNMIAKVRPGDTITFQINRNRKMLNLTIPISSKLMAFPGIMHLRRLASGIVGSDDESVLAEIGLVGDSPQTDPLRTTPRKRTPTRGRPAWNSNFSGSPRPAVK